jgi:hypothetical protein
MVRGLKKNFFELEMIVRRCGFENPARIENEEVLDAGVEKNRKQDEETQNNDGLKKGHGHGQDMPEPHTVAVSHDNCSMRMLDLKVKSAYIVFEIIARVKNRRLWRNTYE